MPKMTTLYFLEKNKDNVYELVKSVNVNKEALHQYLETKRLERKAHPVVIEIKDYEWVSEAVPEQGCSQNAIVRLRDT